MEICNPCDVLDMPSFNGILFCNVVKNLASGEIPYVGFVKCDVTFTDILDTVEWAAKIAAGDVVVLPVGIGSISEKSEKTTKRIQCQNVVTAYEKAFQFNSIMVDTTTLLEWAEYNKLSDLSTSIRPFFITCNNILLINPNWASGENIGLSISKLTVDNIASGEEDSNYEYSIKGIITEPKVFKRVELTTAILTAILPTTV